ncbi:cytochrome c oxidase subunit 2A [Sporosarcina sp. 6E9]|nr:cytochrome c oxidase subunit 2A [Sporosarcina sp. 6E9]MBO1910096.1 hypothetical protein [Microvirga sp. 3-52]
MVTEKTEVKKEVEENEKYSLKGTMFSVGVVAAVIIAAYLLLFVLYMIRV